MATTNSCLVDLTDVILAFEEANLKLLDVVCVADVDTEARVDDSLVENLKLKHGRGLEPEFWSRYRSRNLVKI